MSPDTGYIVPHPEKWTAFERHSLETWVESYCPPNARDALLALLAEHQDGSKYKALWNAASEAASSLDVAIETHVEHFRCLEPPCGDVARRPSCESRCVVASLAEAMKALNAAVEEHEGANDR